ncbi:MAG: diacylglycerol kinase family protein [Candidatus Magasanikbacteria bacterium]|nr:diacylglycerol kinase family protein [Candidatus Magasanikbacteria bacterium]
MNQLRTLIKSFSCAARGIATVFREEQNFRIQLAGTFLVFMGMIYFQLKIWERSALMLVIIIVLVLELINSAMERFVDMTSPRLHAQAMDIKDIMAGAVFIASVGAAVVGVLIFFPYFLVMF